MTLPTEFLNAYAEYLEWPDRGRLAVSRRLCEEYYYSPNHDAFLRIALGWFWGRTNNHVTATGAVATLKYKLDEMYAIVAEENNWGKEDG